ncbi:DEAD/DEAH box helicase [Micromonospora marina]|uniref:Helicase conserved C-terminal domain-containing protein n=1 Tax=Micromonospora marina TaxID=307120 RepID=A0A1C5ALB3_9ACTN|nr:DEAD/DEAH box helicase [Micromonospora marina]SCF45989.1 Helicase conserved C-terminal domain-containing protein [Micromonospora marina]
MGRLVLTADEAAVCEAVGVRSFVQARSLVANGALAEVSWDPRSGRGRAAVQGERSGWVTVTVSVVVGADGALKSVSGACTCSAAPVCAHPAALALIVCTSEGSRPEPASSWELALAGLVSVDSPAVVPGSAELALQFELEDGDGRGRWRIALRPVVPGKRGWIRGGVSWGTLGFEYVPDSPHTQHHVDLLTELLALADEEVSDPYAHRYYGSGQRVVYLDEFRSRRVWDVLAEAREAGLPLVQSGRAASPVQASARPVRFSVRADRVAAGLRLRPALADGTETIDPEKLIVVGRPAHGVAWWGTTGPGSSTDPGTLRLAPLARPLHPRAMGALVAPEIVVPAAEEPRFLRQYYPGLVRQAEVVPADETVSLPELGKAVLTLSVQPLPEHRMSLSWDWVAVVGSENQVEPLHADLHHDSDRAATLQRVTALLADSAYGLTERIPAGRRLLAHAVVADDAMLRLVRDALPRLVEMDGVDVAVKPHDDVPEYVETQEAPVVSFASATGGSAGTQDWFDLSVRVTVDGEEVGFEGLFLALAAEQEFMILPSGRYFRLEQPEFRQLRDLIAESRELEDAPPGVLRVGRFQAGLWQELSELGEVTGQAAVWQESVRGLSDVKAGPADPPPVGLDATLRPYQLEGFRWLATLHRHDLGGVLADDMGLGKTLQALALICHAVERAPAGAPFLVVAPASVVSNWAHEAARFAPHLTVTPIVQTGARRAGTLEQTVAGSHVVVTSYTLFRLEYDDYAALPWTGLILDEAQFVKNAQSQTYRCAKQLPAVCKLAITGTPMENNLVELWALLSITAPGLLPRLDRFTDYYRRPIEKDHDEERLAQLRRRIRPLMLRRRKAEVVTELPAKQEQVIELDLNPKHRRMYQTYLQRERQKVLGLLGDMQKNRFEIFRSLTLLRQASLDLTLVDPKHHAITSTKLDALRDQVTNLAAEGHRVLIFSQFTRFLATARQRLEEAGVTCCYLDGKTRRRAEVIADFKNGTAPAFLVSLKSGGFGLNLTEADYCILLDPWWNPATEAQAVDRVHRIGQTRTVMVYRLVAKDTIEEKVMALQARKAELFSSVLDGGEFASAELTAADIRSLLD